MLYRVPVFGKENFRYVTHTWEGAKTTHAHLSVQAGEKCVFEVL